MVNIPGMELAAEIRAHAELAIEQATARLDAPTHGYNRPEYEEGRDQGIKDACRLLLLVVADFEDSNV